MIEYNSVVVSLLVRAWLFPVAHRLSQVSETTEMESNRRIRKSRLENEIWKVGTMNYDR